MLNLKSAHKKLKNYIIIIQSLNSGSLYHFLYIDGCQHELTTDTGTIPRQPLPVIQEDCVKPPLCRISLSNSHLYIISEKSSASPFLLTRMNINSNFITLTRQELHGKYNLLPELDLLNDLRDWMRFLNAVGDIWSFDLPSAREPSRARKFRYLLTSYPIEVLPLSVLYNHKLSPKNNEGTWNIHLPHFDNIIDRDQIG